MRARSLFQGETWARRLGGGALVLALVGLSGPATPRAAIMEQDGETIEVEGEAHDVGAARHPFPPAPPGSTWRVP